MIPAPSDARPDPHHDWHAWRQRLAARFDLGRSAVWRGALLLIFLLAFGARYGAWTELADRPALREAEWQGTTASAWQSAALAIASGDLVLARGATPITREMIRLRPFDYWRRALAGPLPRGAPGLYLLGLSQSVVRSDALYVTVSLVAGGLLGVLAAMGGALAFGDRRVGVMAGVLVAASGPLVHASLRVGPWAWEALAVGLLLAAGLRAWRDRENPGEWALFGIALAFATWVRPVFWLVVVIPVAAALRTRWRPPLAVVLSVLVPVAISGALLGLRNHRAGIAPVPAVGTAGWDLARNWNRDALARPLVPRDLAFFEASQGSAVRYVLQGLRFASQRKALAPIARERLRWVVGARQSANDVCEDYTRRRSEFLRLATLGPDALMAVFWASLLLLVWQRRLPAALGAGVLLCAASGAAFTPHGDDRAGLLVLAAVVTAGGLVAVWESRRAAPVLPFVFLTLWAGMHLLLQIDDEARGPRYRYLDFARANVLHYRDGNPALGNWEVDDWKDRERYEEALAHR